MEIQAGQSVTVSSAMSRTEQQAIVREQLGDRLALSYETDSCPFQPGNVLQLRMEQYRGLGVLSGVHPDNDVCILTVSGFRWSGLVPRAKRFFAAFRTHVDYLSGKEVRKTVGDTTDISRSGVRIRLRSALAIGTVAHLKILVHEEPVEALGKVRRVIDSGKTGPGGFDVAFSFERMLAGEAILVNVLGSEPDGLEDEPRDNDDWYLMPQAS